MSRFSDVFRVVGEPVHVAHSAQRAYRIEPIDERMQQPLIRPEVIAARRQQWLGEVNLALPPLLGWLSLLCLSAAFVLVLLLCLGSYTRRASVVGEIVPAQGLLRLDARAAGVVSALNVREGSTVKRGDILLLIRVDQSSAALGDTASLVADRLSAQSDRLARSAQLAAADGERNVRALQQELLALRTEQELMQAQRRLKARQLQQATSALARIAPLQQSGVLARRQIDEYEQAVLDAENALNETGLRLLEQERRQRDVAERLSAQPAQAMALDTRLRGEQTALTQALALTEAQHVLRILAPCDGVVAGLGVQLGQSVASDRRLLTLIPANSPLVAQLWVPSSAIGRLATGDRVMLRVDAFPYQQNGRVEARIDEIAATAMAPEDIRRIADRAPDYPAFRVIARLSDSPVKLPLRASMSLIGDVQLDRRRLIQWLYSPLLAGVGVDPQ